MVGGWEGDFFVIVTIIFLQIPTVQTRAQLPLFFFISETEGAVRRGQKDEEVEKRFLVDC